MSHLITTLAAAAASTVTAACALAGAATSAADPGTGSTSDVNTLAGSLSKGYSLSNCAPQPLSSDVIAQVACNQNPDPNGPAGAQYFLFPNADAMASTFKRSIQQDGIKLTNCGESQSPASWSQGNAAGQVACATVQQQGGVAQIIWTTDAKHVMSFIRASNGDVQALYKWWLTNG
ncbi:serine/threonine protein kinase [Mycobacterium sp.]|uniref:serine/threonine protein kinase n=1 Tax=Mycobacterium sp. TaxID=1785 RepID=UPI0025F0D73A|nr:serine/threonine protein kinase [Mycobacterium sp.]MBW0013896.1 serine/threonine protein kinase [Mycobacterium sp.]